MADSDWACKEIDWFARNSYNTALKYCTGTHSSQISRILAASSQVRVLLQLIFGYNAN